MTRIKYMWCKWKMVWMVVIAASQLSYDQHEKRLNQKKKKKKRKSNFGSTKGWAVFGAGVISSQASVLCSRYYIHHDSLLLVVWHLPNGELRTATMSDWTQFYALFEASLLILLKFLWSSPILHNVYPTCFYQPEIS